MGETNIFIVTLGEYSEYGILAVFSTREAADIYAASMRADFEEDGYREPVQVEGYVLDGEE